MLPHALGLLCALGAAAFAATRVTLGSVSALAGGLVVGTLWLRPDSVWVGAGVALVAGLLLARPHLAWVSAGTAGLLAGLWAVVLQGQGVPGPVALGLATAVPVTSASLNRGHAAFAPAPVREEGLAALGVLGLVVAVGRDVAAGWRTAQALNLGPEAGGVVTPAFDPWVLQLATLSVMVGAGYALWKRG